MALFFTSRRGVERDGDDLVLGLIDIAVEHIDGERLVVPLGAGEHLVGGVGGITAAI